ncbi:MAG: RNA methyltransferase [Myxococcota bacterium]|nr:RNA methyltransferase [Myxococcota bacterium]
MARIRQTYEEDGFFGVGILNGTDEINVGTLWRSAFILGASFIFTVARRYKNQSSDVTKAWTKIPLYHYEDLDALKQNLPHSTKLIGVELTDAAIALGEYRHPERAAYLLGNEQVGLSEKTMGQCHELVQLPGNFSLNVSVAGSILLYDRISKISTVYPKRFGVGAEGP